MTLLRILASLGMALASLGVAADEWPSRPVKVIVPLPAGTGPDVLARILAADLAERLAQPVLVENRPGGGENIGIAAVVQAAPDGYTLLFTATSVAANPHLYHLSFDPEKDLAAVAQVGTTQFILVARPELAVRNAAELIALAKARPGALSCAQSTGALLISCAWLKSAGGIDIALIPYKGSVQALIDVVGGRVDMTFAVPGPAAAQVHAGRLVALASTAAPGSDAARRAPPPLGETLPGFQLVSWFGLLAPARTPAIIVQRLEREVGAALREPHTRGAMERAGHEPAFAPAAAFAQTIRQTRERYGRIIRESGIRAD